LFNQGVNRAKHILWAYYILLSRQRLGVRYRKEWYRRQPKKIHVYSNRGPYSKHCSAVGRPFPEKGLLVMTE
jgi:hypothetical protein